MPPTGRTAIVTLAEQYRLLEAEIAEAPHHKVEALLVALDTLHLYAEVDEDTIRPDLW